MRTHTVSTAKREKTARRKSSMNKRVAELTLRDLDSMNREELIEKLMEITQFFPCAPNLKGVEEIPENDLRNLVNRARRKLHGLGY